MTDPALSPVERSVLIKEMQHAVYKGYDAPLNQTMVMWKPDEKTLTDENLRKLHTLALEHGMNYSNASSIRQIMKSWTIEDSDRIGRFLDDLLVHLKAVDTEYDGIRFKDSESLPFFIHELQRFRDKLPSGVSYTREQELSFLILLPFAPWYARYEHYASFYAFVQQHSLQDARTALRLLGDYKVERLSEAEHVLEDKPVPLANGVL